MLRNFPQVLAKQMVSRTMRIAERSSTLPVMQTVAKNVTDGCQDMVVAVQGQKENLFVEERTLSVMPVPVILGDPHFHLPAKLGDFDLFGRRNAVDMCGHNGVGPQFDLAGKCLQSKNVGDGTDIFGVPEQDLFVGSDAEMIKPFHNLSFVNRKLANEVSRKIAIPWKICND